MDKERLIEKLEERVSDMEQRQAVAETEHRHLQDDVIDIKNSQQEVLQQMKKLSEDLARYRGMLGGIMLVGSCLAAFFKLFWGDLKRLFIGG